MNDKRRILSAVLIALSLTLTAYASLSIVSSDISYKNARDEYMELRASKEAMKPPPVTQGAASASPPEQTEGYVPVPEQVQTEATPDLRSLSAVNPDYIGWISVEGTLIDYPAVRGEDNAKYLNTTFGGDYNPSGTVFMDCKCADGFGGAFAILYGHNMNDGSMFASLLSYLDDTFVSEHPYITINTLDNTELRYRVFAVELTNVSDEAYSIPEKSRQDAESYIAGLNADTGARVLALSTCTFGGDDERLLVFAVME